nr:Gag-Pol polyprotein [Tanacetum cinerariifolium]
MIGNLNLLINFVWKFLGTIRFRNDHVAAILGFGDLQWGNILITRVYFVDGLGHNLFSVGQFCDSDLEVAFRRNACFVRNLDGVDLLKGNRSTNLYTINLHEMASASPIYLMDRASSTKSWLWHQRLSHLNFDTINDLAKNDLVSGLLKFKYHKEHLCPLCEQGKSKRASHPPKPVPNSRQRLHLLHMDLCGPMRIASINEKRYFLVIVEDYSRYTRTLVVVARTMLIFSRAPLFLWAEAIATACFTQNRSIIHCHFNKTPYELINDRKPNISFLHVFGALCYPKNDREDIGKLGEKGDIGFFIGYSADSCAYRIYNRRTKKIIETMNVSFDEISAMAFDQRSSKPRLQSMTSGQISSGLDLTYAPSTITTQQPTEDTAPTPTNSSSQATNFPNPSQDVDGLNSQQQHAQHQGNQAPLQPKTVVDNVPNAMFDANTFFNPFANPSTSAAESSSSQKMDPSNMHTFCQPKMVIRNKSHLVVRGYRQEEGIDFEESFAPVARMEAIRIFLAYAAHKSFTVFQMDVKTAFLHGTIDPTLFIRRFDDDILVVYVYVDDIIFGSTHPRYTQLFSDLVKSRFEMLMMGEMTFFLGLQVNQSPRGIFINQSNYVLEILKNMERNLVIPWDYGFELTGFLDADYAGCKDTFKSTSGEAQFLGEKLVSWSSKKQDCTALSTTKAEYVSLSACCAQVLWMRTQLTDYGFHFKKISIYCDSKSAIAISCNLADYELADIFTKALPADRFNYLVHRLESTSNSFAKDSNYLIHSYRVVCFETFRDSICSLNSIDNENSVAHDKTKCVNDIVSLDEEEISMSNGMETIVELGKMEGNGNRDEQKVDEVMHAESYDKNVCKDADEIVKSIEYDNKLIQIPTKIDNDGNEFEIFDEKLLDDGNKRWELTIGLGMAMVITNKGQHNNHDFVGHVQHTKNNKKYDKPVYQAKKINFSNNGNMNEDKKERKRRGEE